MATEYKITYTYAGQDNTSGSRSVALSKFKKSGDTGRKIGQIKSIKYEHWHTSDKAANWALRGRLVFSDGTTITSNTVTQTISGTKVKYTNTFTKLPTPEQFALLKTVQTLDSQGKTTADGYSAKLYWRANSVNPMRLIVTFIEEPPVVYDPKVDAFDVKRTDENGKEGREELYIRTSLKLSIGNSAGLSGATCKIYYAADAQPVVGEANPIPPIDLTSRIPDLITGVTDVADILTGQWALGRTWFFVVVFAAGEEVAFSKVLYVERGTTSLHISGEPGGGVAIGGFSNGTSQKTETEPGPMFESHVPAFFYAGINGVTNYSDKEVKTGGTWIDGNPIYRKVIVAKAGSSSAIATIDTIANFASLVRVYGSAKRTSTNTWYNIPTYGSDSVWNDVYVMSDGSVRARSSFGNEATFYVAVEYTKTN